MNGDQTIDVTFIGGTRFSYVVSQAEASAFANTIKTGKSIVSFRNDIGETIFINVFRSDKIEIKPR